MSKVKILEINESEKRDFFNDKLICIDSKKIFVEGNNIIKMYNDYLTVDDKLIIDIEIEPQDNDYIDTIDNIKNINGIHQIGNTSLNTFLDSFNDDFISLDESINKMKPLLEMLEIGEYYINYVNIFPTTTNGNFFWNFDSDSKVYNNLDYGYLTPLYIRGTESYDFYNENRVKYYLDRYEKTQKRPTPIIVNLSGNDYENLVLDGHHKIIASYLRNEPIKAIMIMRTQKNIKNSLKVIHQKNGILNFELLNSFPSSISSVFDKIEYKSKKDYKSRLNKEKNIEYRNIFNDKKYNTKNKYPNLVSIISIYHLHPNNFSKDEDNLNIKQRCIKLLNLFLNDRKKSKDYALKIAKQSEIDIDVYLAFTILYNFDDEDVIFFFSDYYTNYCGFDETTNYLYEIATLYLGIEE